ALPASTELCAERPLRRLRRRVGAPGLLLREELGLSNQVPDDLRRQLSEQVESLRGRHVARFADRDAEVSVRLLIAAVGLRQMPASESCPDVLLELRDWLWGVSPEVLAHEARR